MKIGLSAAASLQDFNLIEKALTGVCRIEFIESETELFSKLDTEEIQFITLDPAAESFNVIKTAGKVHTRYPEMPIFIISNSLKMPPLNKILGFMPSGYFLISYNLEYFRNSIFNLFSRTDLPPNRNPHEDILYKELIGISSAANELRRFILKAAKQDYPVTLYGETGSGKDLAAKLIHYFSAFKCGPYIPVNVSCIPNDLADSILFGVKRGSYTDAITRNGFLIDAHRGTLFLDEIEDLSLNIQAKLLRALETHVVRPLGAEKEEEAHFRLICASNKNIKEMVDNKLFREDLFYRIDVLRFTIEPLRNRTEDIPLLAKHHCGKYNKTLTEKALHKLSLNVWKGNVRELFNCLNRAQANAHPKNIITERDIEF